jgi:nitronate monooxygenase
MSFTKLLGLKYPIVQAPMAGVSCAALVAQVSKAGALGSFGHAYTEPDAMHADARYVREHAGNAPFHINLFVDSQPPAQCETAVAAAAAAIANWFAQLDLPLPTACLPPYAPNFDAQVATALEITPRLLSSHLNVFAPEIVSAAKARGILLAGSATNVAEALELQARGYDMVIAQSCEAGGHRGTFIGSAADSMIGTFSLVRLISGACKLPVIAAGGIMDGAGIAASLLLGASAAQLGTAFLNVDEALTGKAHREALTANVNGDSTTAITTAFSGRPAQGIRNAYMLQARQAQEQGKWAQLPFPAQNKLTAALRAAGAKAGNPQVLSMWAGHAHALARQLPAAILVELLAAELHRSLQGAAKAY